MRRIRHKKPDQIALPWPGQDETCPRCRGTREVYHRASPPGVEIFGGKRMPCPTCQAIGTVRAPVTAPVANPPAVQLGAARD